jgi:hypothetical protein
MFKFNEVFNVSFSIERLSLTPQTNFPFLTKLIKRTSILTTQITIQLCSASLKIKKLPSTSHTYQMNFYLNAFNVSSNGGHVIFYITMLFTLRNWIISGLCSRIHQCKKGFRHMLATLAFRIEKDCEIQLCKLILFSMLETMIELLYL